MSRTAPVPRAEGQAPLLRAEGLVKTHYGEGAPAFAVRGVDLAVRQGEFVAVTAPDGARKSTRLPQVGRPQRAD
ncbi:ABC transporter ATP-binding protein, partial [Streptomyces sp. NPDC127044]